MDFELTEKKPFSGQQTFYLMKNEDSYDKLNTKDMTDRISRESAKKYIRDFLTNKANSFKNMIIHVAYITDEGMVNLIKNVQTDENGVTNSDISTLMADPTINQYEKSGEYNNMLEGKRIYGVTITVIKTKQLPAATVQKVKPVAKNKRKFDFSALP